jgi:putative nucleotidyltransferase with HDIG domain
MAVKRILIIDCDPQVGAGMVAALEKVGYAAVLDCNGADAVRRISKGAPFDVLLLDIMLPGVDGLALLERIRSARPEIPVVLVTAMYDVNYAITAMKKGAFDYLLKPIESDHLLSTVNRALEHQEAERQMTMDRQDLEQLVEARTELLSRAIADLERSYDITLEALGNALDLKDTETEGHSKRVTAYAIVLARAMHLDAFEIKIIARGAFLHDIGKMAIPDAILSKPGKLTAEEQVIMREHCVRGYAMLKKIPFLEKAAEIVFSHQEHYDGGGYSRGLKGDQIPLGARIFAIADALDAITSDRPYRKAQSFAAARKEIERCSGTQFDPAIVAVYRMLPDQIWEDLRSEIDHPTGTGESRLAGVIPNR